LNIGYLQENGLTVMFHTSDQENASCIILIKASFLFVKYPHEERSCFQVTIEDLQYLWRCSHKGLKLLQSK